MRDGIAVFLIIAHQCFERGAFDQFGVVLRNAHQTEGTIELFGTPDPATGKMRPFHVYSMRQAIEENFILDVLANYTTIKEWRNFCLAGRQNPYTHTKIFVWYR